MPSGRLRLPHLRAHGVRILAQEEHQWWPRAQAVLAARQADWRWDYSPRAGHAAGLQPNRERRKHVIGAVEPRSTAPRLELDATADESAS